jgi:hypothetical protein
VYEHGLQVFALAHKGRLLACCERRVFREKQSYLIPFVVDNQSHCLADGIVIVIVLDGCLSGSMTVVWVGVLQHTVCSDYRLIAWFGKCCEGCSFFLLLFGSTPVLSTICSLLLVL